MIRRRAGPPAAVWGVVAIAALLAVAWSIVIPVYEAPDEPHHWRVARYIHDHGHPPRYDASMAEANQPPTYYALIAPLARSDSRPSAAAWMDGEDRLHLPFPPRLYLNEADAWSHYGWLRLARILTALVSAVGIWVVYLGAAEATGSRTLGLLAAGLAGFLPQFSFRAGSISNDTLLVPFSAAATWLSVRMVRRGFSWKAAGGAAVAAAAAYLTKINASCLVPPLLLAVASGAGTWSERVRRVVGTSCIFGVVVLPWTLWNVSVYGNPFATGAMRVAVREIVDVKPITSPYFWTTFPVDVSRSFVGLFGWFNLALPQWMYSAYGLIGLAGGSGLVAAAALGRASRRAAVVLLATVAANVAVIVHINLTFTQPQGRYLFPGLPAVVTLVALGGLILPAAVRRVASAALVAAALALNVYALLGVAAPAYYPAVVRTAAATAIEIAPPEGGTGLERGSDGFLRITSSDPQVSLPVTVAAGDVNFLQFELEGMAPDGVVLGSVYFARTDSPASEQQRVDFRWKADGRKRTISVALAGAPEWRGVVTTIRIDPINGRTEANREARLRIGRVWLRGRL